MRNAMRHHSLSIQKHLAAILHPRSWRDAVENRHLPDVSITCCLCAPAYTVWIRLGARKCHFWAACMVSLENRTHPRLASNPLGSSYCKNVSSHVFGHLAHLARTLFAKTHHCKESFGHVLIWTHQSLQGVFGYRHVRASFRVAG